jgi:hypothetical protein
MDGDICHWEFLVGKQIEFNSALLVDDLFVSSVARRRALRRKAGRAMGSR